MRIYPKQIMCALDFSGFAPLILSYGKALAREFDAQITLCHVVQDTVMLSSHAQAGFSTEEVTARRLEDAKQALESLAWENDTSATIRVSLGHPADEITRLAKKHRIDLVIGATHGGSGVKRFLVGSVTDRLVKTLECPLLVLHSRSKEKTDRIKLPLKRILVGCDFSKGSGLAFDYALSLAQEFEAELHLVHVVKPHIPLALAGTGPLNLPEDDFPEWDDPLDREKSPEEKSQKRLEAQLNQMVPQESRHWCTPVIGLCQGEPYRELINYSDIHKIDMIVLGIHGHSLLDKFLVGSTTDRVISRANCPVMAVRQTR